MVEYLLGKEEVTSSNLVTGLLLSSISVKGFRFIALGSKLGSIERVFGLSIPERMDNFKVCL